MDLNIWGHNGTNMEEGVLDSITSNFDWVCFKDHIHKKIDFPTSVYIKTDYIHKWFEDLKKIDNYDLYCGASDSSAQDDDKFLLLLDVVRKAYIENKKIEHPKVYAMSVGLATHSLDQEKFLLNYIAPKNKFDRVFCRWRGRDCPQRRTAYYFACFESRCDIYKDEMEWTDYIRTMSKYKFALCPVGFGEDPAPRILEVLACGVIPVCLNTLNTLELYKKYNIYFLEKWEDFNIDFQCSRHHENVLKDFCIQSYLKMLSLPSQQVQ